MGKTAKIAFRQTMLAASTPYWLAFKCGYDDVTAFQLVWHDATSAFAASVYSSLEDNPTVPATATAAPDLTQWFAEVASVTIPTVTAGAAGSVIRHLGNNGAKWIMIKIEPSADSIISLLTHGKMD